MVAAVGPGVLKRPSLVRFGRTPVINLPTISKLTPGGKDDDHRNAVLLVNSQVEAYNEAHMKLHM